MRPAIIAVVTVSALAQVPFEFSITAIAADTNTPLTLYIATGTGLFKSGDSGRTWTPFFILEPGVRQPAVNTILVHPNNRTLYAATTLASGGVWRSNDAGVKWTNVSRGLPQGPGGVNQLFLIPETPAVLYARIGMGVYKTTDSGANWTLQTTLPLSAQNEPIAFAVNLKSPNVMYTGRQVLLRSMDEGQTWTEGGAIQMCGPESSGIPSIEQVTTPAADPSAVYLFAMGSPSCFYSSETGTVTRWCDTVFRSSDYGANITTSYGPNWARIVADPESGGALYLMEVLPRQCNTTSGLKTAAHTPFAKSLDGGKSWTAGSSPKFLTSRFAFGDRARDILYAGCDNTSLCTSADGGRTWSVVDGKATLTVARPQAVSFTLAPGETGRRTVPLEFLERPNFAAPVQVTVSGGSWLRFGVSSSTTPSTMVLTISTTGLEKGNYEGSVTITPPPSAGQPITVPVMLSVVDPDLGAPRYTATYIAGTGKSGDGYDGSPALLAPLNNPQGMCLNKAGVLYIADMGNHRIRKVANGVFGTVAGTGKPGKSGDGGPALQAELNLPQAVACDASGAIYVAEFGNAAIRKITPEGTISTFATLRGAPLGLFFDPEGRLHVLTLTGVSRVASNGALTAITPAAAFTTPYDAVFDGDGNLYVVDRGAHRVYKVGPKGGIEVVAGSGLAGFDGNGRALESSLNAPQGVAVDSRGMVHVADSSNRRVRSLTPDGRIHAIAGPGSEAAMRDGGSALDLYLSIPARITAAPDGSLYVSDGASHRVFKLTRQAPEPRILAGPLNAASRERMVAPGSLALITGLDLTTAYQQPDGPPWPATLGQVSVLVGGIPAPLYSVQPSEIAFQIPYETTPGPNRVEVEAGGAKLAADVEVGEAAPGIWTREHKRAVAENEDGSPNGPANGALAGSVVRVHFTGMGAAKVAVATGEASPSEPAAEAALPVIVRVGGVECTVVFAGLTPGAVGAAHADIVIPDLQSGDHEVVVSINGADSNAAIITVGEGPESPSRGMPARR